MFLWFFAVGLGATPWAINSEIFPMHLRGIGNSMGTTANWITNYFVSQIFLTATSTKIGEVATFSSLALICGLFWIFIYKRVPETKGKPIDEIVNEINRNHKK